MSNTFGVNHCLTVRKLVSDREAWGLWDQSHGYGISSNGMQSVLACCMFNTESNQTYHKLSLYIHLWPVLRGMLMKRKRNWGKECCHSFPREVAQYWTSLGIYICSPKCLCACSHLINQSKNNWRAQGSITRTWGMDEFPWVLLCHVHIIIFMRS